MYAISGRRATLIYREKALLFIRVIDIDNRGFLKYTTWVGEKPTSGFEPISSRSRQIIDTSAIQKYFYFIFCWKRWIRHYFAVIVILAEILYKALTS